MYVERLFAGLKRHLRQPFRFVCMTEQNRIANFSNGIERHEIEDLALTKIKGCFARLRMFDLGWQDRLGLNDRIVCLDLDTVLVGDLDVLFDYDDRFIILSGANASNPCPYTACIFMLQAGAHPELWDEFAIDAVARIPRYEFPDDQGWMHFKIPHAATWPVGQSHGIYAYKKPGWPHGDELPVDARIVAFPGSRDPSKISHLSWVKEHWR
jgi:hypothetical protein